MHRTYLSLGDVPTMKVPKVSWHSIPRFAYNMVAVRAPQPLPYNEEALQAF